MNPVPNHKLVELVRALPPKMKRFDAAKVYVCRRWAKPITVAEDFPASS